MLKPPPDTMTHEIRVSRHGLTRCPSCLAHIQIAEDWVRTTCPFCAASLLTATREGPRELMDVLRNVHASAGGALAASLLSVGLAACGTADLQGLTPHDTGVQVHDAGNVNDAGDTELVDAGDMIPAPEYGLPPPVDAGGVDAMVVDAGDMIPSPEYGLPPPMDASVEDAMVVDAGEGLPQPHYGSPGITDGGIQRIDAGDEDGGVTVALYGGAAIDAG